MDEFVLVLAGFVTGMFLTIMLGVAFMPEYKSDYQIICEYSNGKWIEAEDYKKSTCIKDGAVFTDPKDVK